MKTIYKKRDGSARVLRGGRWDNDARYCRLASRSNNSPGYRSRNIGFRPSKNVKDDK